MDGISWDFSEGLDKCFFIGKEMKIGKYRFLKTQNAMSEEEYQKKTREQKSTPDREEFLMTVHWEIPSESHTQILNETKQELSELLQLISLQVNRYFDIGVSYHVSPDGAPTLHAISRLLSKHTELSEDILKTTVHQKEVIDSLDDDRKRLIQSALNWYSRGLREHNPVNAYASYWIGFETLSMWYDGVPEEQGKCDKCNQMIYNLSIAKRLKIFTKTLNVPNASSEEINTLYAIRNALFHRSNEKRATEHLAVLGSMLKNSLELLLK